VRLHLTDGTVHELSVVYTGWDEQEQVHVWEAAISDVALLGHGVVALTSDALPARTRLQLPLNHTEVHNGR
jgi:hypothetical protein